jgi:SRSO17 transposase
MLRSAYSSAYASRRGQALIDRDLHLPAEWTGDRQRCRSAGIEDAVTYATKPVLAQRMIDRAVRARVSFGWVTGDEAYGDDSGLRIWLEAKDIAHVFAVPTDNVIAPKHRRTVGWVRVTGSDGRRGARSYDWTVVDVRPVRRGDWRHWLLARRSISEPNEIASYVGFGPSETTVAELARVAECRWAIEQCFSSPATRPVSATIRSAGTRRGTGTSRCRWWRRGSSRSPATGRDRAVQSGPIQI